MTRFHMMKGSFISPIRSPRTAQPAATYQVAPHGGGVPVSVDSPQEAKQQGVAHPLAAVVAAVALPATGGGGKKKRIKDAEHFMLGLINAIHPLYTHIMACWRGERSVCTAWCVSTVQAAGHTWPFQL